MGTLRRLLLVSGLCILYFAESEAYANNINLIAVGGAGTIRQSPDSGGNWYIRSGGTVNGLIAVDCVLQNCWIVGAGGTILHSPDGGVTWTPQSSGIVHSLLDVDFVDSKTGWAVGNNGTILKTVDGGANWSPLDSSTPGVQFRSVYALSQGEAWAAGQNGAIRRTSDGGINWSFQTPAMEEDVLINDIYFLSNAVGLYGGTYSGLRVGITNNGGATWAPAETDPLSGGIIHAIDFVDSQSGWLTGDYGLVGYTTDGGLTWQRSMSVGTNAAFVAIAMIDEDRGWIAGASGQIRATQNGGQSWAGQSSGTTQTLLDIIAVQPARLPDFDEDGDIDGRDFLVWQRGYGSPKGATFEQGDASGDGRVDSADLELWQGHYGAGPSDVSFVPEPSNALLLPIGYLIIVGARWRCFSPPYNNSAI